MYVQSENPDSWHVALTKILNDHLKPAFHKDHDMWENFREN